ncbi:unnamed protein product [Linum trigynum]|uniref:Uncharacterized protein n=1 Tax=Linum trigynum TaxID=586398 RepID=A0AAV2CTN3_9ROSI
MALIMHILSFMDSGRKASELEPIVGLDVPPPAAEEEEGDEEEVEGARGEDEEVEGQEDEERRSAEPQGTPEGAVRSEEE